jgi:photosystem II stability/assembly factor-like uncharacterized protein
LLIYYGAEQASIPFGNGFRCVGGGGVGFFRFPVLQIDGSGTVDMKVDYTVPPAGGDHHDPGVWIPGSTWYCQAWYRDPAGGGSSFNLSDGLEVQVCAGDTTLAFSENFDGVQAPDFPAGWTLGANASNDAGNTVWELGTPSTVGPSAANSVPNCIGTNLHDNYGINTDIWVRTPSIDLTGNTEATLSFREFKGIEASGADLDFGTIRILAALDLVELAVLEAEVDGTSTGWEAYSVALPVVAFDEAVVIEFQFQADATDLIGVENGGFELPVMADGEWNTWGGPGWSVLSGSGGIWNPDATDGYPGGAAPEGQNIGWASGGSLSQSLGATLSANTQYDLGAQVGHPLWEGGGAGGSYRIELLAGGVLLDVQAGNAPGQGQWQAHSLTYDSGPNPAQLGQPLEIRLLATGSQEVNFDDVTLTGVSDAGALFPGWYIDDIEIRLESPDTGGSWQVLPNSPLAPYYHHDDIFFIDDLTGWVCNISGEIWKTTDGGDNWTRVLNQPGTSFRTLTFVDDMNGWVGNLGVGGWAPGITDPNPLYATTDGGMTWTAVTNISGPVPDGICGMQAIGPATIHGTGRYAGGAYFISSTDGGASWISQDLNAAYGAFVDLLFFTPDEGYITAHVNAPGGQDAAQLLHTTDGGASWTTVMSSDAYHYWKIGFASDTFGYGSCWSGQDADKWIQTYDGGQNWTDQQFAGGFESNGIGFLNEQTGWIGGHEPTTYQTTDGGDTWQLIQIDTIYGDYINKFLKVSDSVIYAVGMRVYKYSSGNNDAHAAPVSSHSGFDNSLCTLDAKPSNDGTALTYTVPEDGHVQITLYERGGLIHDRPVDEHQRAGTYTIELNAHDDVPVLYASIVTGRYRHMIKLDDQP